MTDDGAALRVKVARGTMDAGSREEIGMAAASTGRGTGIALAVFVGGPALVVWGLWALNLTIAAYALVMTASGAEPPR